MPDILYTLVIITHFVTNPQEAKVAINIESYAKCMMLGMQRIGRPLGSEDIAYRCDRQNGKQ